MRLTIFTLLFVLCFSVKAQIPQQITGNWINQNTNDWEYGFFEDFAIYNCGFWQYQSVKTKGSKSTLILQQGDKIVNLEVNAKSDDLITVKKEKQKAQQYVLMKKQYPDYKTRDTTPFPVPEFKQDSATIIGYYRNFNKIPQEFKERFGHSYFEISIPNFVVDEDIGYRTTIDSLGRFSITVPIVNTQSTYTDGGITQWLVLQPNDTLFLFADLIDFFPQEDEGWNGYQYRKKQILFMGKNARLNNENIQYGYHEPRIFVDRYKEVENGVTNMALLRKLEEVYNKKISYLNEYKSQHVVSDKFATYVKEYLKYGHANDLMQHRFDVRRENKRFEEGYMEYVNKTFPLYNKDVYTLLNEYKRFLKDYIGYADDATGTKTTINMEKVGEVLEKEGRLTPETKSQIDDYNKLIQKIQAITDTTEQRKLVESASELISSINSNTLIMKTVDVIITELFLKKEVALVDSMLSEPVVKEWYITSIFYDRLDHEHYSLTAQEIKLFEEKVTNPLLREQIMSLHNHYEEIAKQSIENESSLKNTDHLSDVFNPDELFSKLIEPYKGKVIYVDFWGTWCGPCRENMKLVGAVEESLHGEDVIFMYLANNSPELSWKNIIKEMDLTGKNIVHYRLPSQQQSMIERKFSINSFPTYMIIDKEGKVVNSKAPSPRAKDKLVSEIRNLLK